MKKYHVYGIGNALLDRDAKVNASFFPAFNIEENVMTLTDEATHQRLLLALTNSFCHSGCGGSAANTLIALSQFGGRGFFSCKVANDEAGHLFLQELNALGIDCNMSQDSLSPGVTGQCLVLVNGEGQRTMNTHLGISETLSVDDLHLEAIAQSEYLYLEGYLVTSPSAKNAMIEAKKQAKACHTKIALTLSDPNIVRYFKKDLVSLIGNQVDLLFCNEDEALLFTDSHDLETAVALLQPMAHHLIVTCGSRGAMLAIDGEVVLIPTTAIENPIDTVGAGDQFAGAYLYGITQGYSPLLAVELANKAAAEVVSQFGARLANEKTRAIKKQFTQANYRLASLGHQELPAVNQELLCE
ncbi:MAG: adenosine kinase [Tatlockia sp.]|jgi:sugar/nucleoside kinase (ribokinase family)